MASITKVARVIGLTTLVGAVSLAGVKYTSQYDSIKDVIDDLKERALDWKELATYRQGQLEELQGKYDTLEANYRAILDILNIEDGADIEAVKSKVQEIYNNASSTGIEGTNQMLQSIANALGIELTDADMNDNGVYKVERILDELETLNNELDKLEEAIGDLVVNLNAGDMEYSEDMSLTEKINYLIGQINVANQDQTTIKTYAEGALDEVEAVPGEETPSDPEQEEPEVTEPTLEEQLAEAEANLRTAYAAAQTMNMSFTVDRIINDGYTLIQTSSTIQIRNASGGGGGDICMSNTAEGQALWNAYQTWLALK